MSKRKKPKKGDKPKPPVPLVLPPWVSLLLGPFYIVPEALPKGK